MSGSDELKAVYDALGLSGIPLEHLKALLSDKLFTRLAALEQRYEESESRCEELERALFGKGEAMDRALRDLQNKYTALAAREEEFESLKATFENEVGVWTQMLTRFKAESVAIERENAKLQEQLDESKKEKEKALVNLKKAIDKAKLLKDRNDELERSCIALQKKSSELEAQVSELKKQKDSVTQSRDMFKTRSDNLQKEYAALEKKEKKALSQLSDKGIEMKKLKEKASSLEKELANSRVNRDKLNELARQQICLNCFCWGSSSSDHRQMESVLEEFRSSFARK
jgi:chromosome segregation ATPase